MAWQAGGWAKQLRQHAGMRAGRLVWGSRAGIACSWGRAASQAGAPHSRERGAGEWLGVSEHKGAVREAVCLPDHGGVAVHRRQHLAT